MAQLITNHNRNFLNYIKEELKTCDSFMFSVSFIKNAGLSLIEKDMILALERGVEGHILTSTYQNFTDVVSLEKFLGWQSIYPNFSCRVDHLPLGERGFHSKGYIFRQYSEYHTLIGSSNITSFALLRNIEWNTRIVSGLIDPFTLDVVNEFSSLWEKATILDQNFIDDYRELLEYAIDQWDMDYFEKFNNIEPNFMQKKALKELARYRGLGVTKSLVVSATGSGKTFLSAFDARNFGAEKLLFVVHRETILKDALETFRKVFGNTRTYGLFTGNTKNRNVDFIFATNVMLSKSLEQFAPDEFDYIVLDECQHATSDTYRKIMSHFQPKFFLGLTATPERMDNQDVFALFDKNVPYELRLREALENDLIVPFKYYGIYDDGVNYGSNNRDLLRQMTSPEHCNFLAEHIEKHRPKGKLKALIFCRSVEHAEQMSEAFRALNYATDYLVGRHDMSERKIAFNQLQSDSHPLELLFSVDLLNEGVDLPAVNMVVFLRPTESSTIFIQQLGRGLRKYPQKEFLTVLDFIGNAYERSVQIAIALGSLSKSSVIEKHLLKEYIKKGFSQLNLPIEIHFDEKSREEILYYIEKTNFNRFDFLKQDYFNFKKIIGAKKYVRHLEYVNNEYAPDLIRFIKTSLGNNDYGYYSFLKKLDEMVPDLATDELEIIKHLSSKLPLVRPYEFSIIKELMFNKDLDLKKLKDQIRAHWFIDEEHFLHSIDYLQNKFLSLNEQIKIKPLIVNEGLSYSLGFKIASGGFKDFLLDLLNYGLERYLSEFGRDEIGLRVFHNYTTEQFMMMTLQKSIRYFKGTKFESDHTTYILAGLKKDLDADHHLNYKDKFLSDSIFQWESETNATLSNGTGQKIQKTKIAHLFIRKKDREDSLTLPYIYIGTGTFQDIRPSSNRKRTLLVNIHLDHQIPETLHHDFQIEVAEKTP
ncbi:MAG: DUF3427 domain-containing protein [Bacilli bacterium]